MHESTKNCKNNYLTAIINYSLIFYQHQKEHVARFINYQNNEGNTALHLVCYYSDSSSYTLSAIEILSRFGANFLIQNHNGETALWISLIKPLASYEESEIFSENNEILNRNEAAPRKLTCVREMIIFQSPIESFYAKHNNGFYIRKITEQKLIKPDFACRQALLQKMQDKLVLYGLKCTLIEILDNFTVNLESLLSKTIATLSKTITTKIKARIKSLIESNIKVYDFYINIIKDNNALRDFCDEFLQNKPSKEFLFEYIILIFYNYKNCIFFDVMKMFFDEELFIQYFKKSLLFSEPLRYNEVIFIELLKKTNFLNLFTTLKSYMKFLDKTLKNQHLHILQILFDELIIRLNDNRLTISEMLMSLSKFLNTESQILIEKHIQENQENNSQYLIKSQILLDSLEKKPRQHIFVTCFKYFFNKQDIANKVALPIKDIKNGIEKWDYFFYCIMSPKSDFMIKDFSTGNSFLHYFLEHNFKSGIFACLYKYPEMFNVANKKGETPTHLLATKFMEGYLYKIQDLNYIISIINYLLNSQYSYCFYTENHQKITPLSILGHYNFMEKEKSIYSALSNQNPNTTTTNAQKITESRSNNTCLSIQ